MTGNHGRKYLIRICVLGMLLGALLGTAAGAAWKTNSGGTRYYNKQKEYVTGWEKISGKWYYFDESGYLQKGWLTLNNKRYYLDKKTGARVSGKWFSVGKYSYYANSKGVVQKNKWIQNCYVKANYRRASGWLEKGNNKYYMNPSNGKKTVGWKTIKKKKYYFDSKGRMVAGKWKKIKGKYYYFNKNGVLKTNTWVGKYKVGKNGARTGQTRSTGIVKSGGKYYYYNKNYKKVSGWVTVGKETYYFGAGKAAVTGLRSIDGQTYYFQSNGVMATGWQTVSGKTYYFDAGGVMLRGCTVNIDGQECSFDANGVCTDSGRGQKIAQYAKKFEGNPYKYGGTSLTKGADCSGFAYAVMKHFKIQIPRVADDQCKGKDGYGTYAASKVIKTNLTSLKPGDLIFYGSKKPLYADHVGIYIGDGKIIHACDETRGIVVDRYNYRTPIQARRYW